MNSINLRNLPTYNLLTQTFKCISWKTLHKQVPNTFNCIKFQKLYPRINNLFTKPISLGHIVLTTRSKMGWKSYCQYQSIRIVIINRKIIVLSPIGTPTALPSEFVMLIMRKTFLQQWYIAITSPSVVERAFSVYNFETNKMEKSVNMMINLVFILSHSVSVGFSCS